MVTLQYFFFLLKFQNNSKTQNVLRTAQRTSIHPLRENPVQASLSFITKDPTQDHVPHVDSTSLWTSSPSFLL